MEQKETSNADCLQRGVRHQPRKTMYKYSELRPNLFTDDGQKLFLAIRDKTHRLLNLAGSARCEEMMSGNSGSSWDMLACVDRMVELGEIREITNGNVAGQHRVFVSARHDA